MSKSSPVIISTNIPFPFIAVAIAIHGKVSLHNSKNMVNLLGLFVSRGDFSWDVSVTSPKIVIKLTIITIISFTVK